MFSDIEYRINHGKSPRGRGSWAFATRRDFELSEVFWFNGTLTSAKKAAAAHFGSASVIYILS